MPCESLWKSVKLYGACLQMGILLPKLRSVIWYVFELLWNSSLFVVSLLSFVCTTYPLQCINLLQLYFILLAITDVSQSEDFLKLPCPLVIYNTFQSTNYSGCSIIHFWNICRYMILIVTTKTLVLLGLRLSISLWGIAWLVPNVIHCCLHGMHLQKSKGLILALSLSLVIHHIIDVYIPC